MYIIVKAHIHLSFNHAYNISKSINRAVDHHSQSIGRKINMIKSVAVLLLVILSTSALRNPTRHMIHHKVFLEQLVATGLSSCDSIIADCNRTINSIADRYNLSTNEGLARYYSDTFALVCGRCFNDFESYYRCIDDDDLAEELREGDCVRSNVDGKYCTESLFDGLLIGVLRFCDEEDDACVTTCQDLRTERNYLGCCASSYEQYGSIIITLGNTTQEFADCNATLGEPCSGVSTTPALSLFVIAVLALITFSNM